MNQLAAILIEKEVIFKDVNSKLYYIKYHLTENSKSEIPILNIDQEKESLNGNKNISKISKISKFDDNTINKSEL